MADISVRVEGRVGRITLTRPKALNALSYGMCTALDAALVAWRDDPAVAMVLIDAEGPRAFCAGGDIASMHAIGRHGDAGPAQRFWRDEYRMNARLAGYPKPIVSLMQGFVMGGGVGIGCHVSHRIVGETSQIAMPECGIGLIPDVGGTLRLARAPGRLGEYFGLTGARMGPGDAIHAGFADAFVPEARWPDLARALIESADPRAIARFAAPAPEAPAARHAAEIDRIFAGEDVAGILVALADEGSDFAAGTLAVLRRNSPLSMVCTLDLVRASRRDPDMRHALEREYRYTHRAIAGTDFIEGVRAAVIDKDRAPKWMHADVADIPPGLAASLIAPLGPETLTFPEERA